MNTERNSIYATLLSGGLLLTTVFTPGGGYYIDKLFGGGAVVIPLDNGQRQTTIIPKGRGNAVVLDENQPGSADYYKTIGDEEERHTPYMTPYTYCDSPIGGHCR